MFRISWGYTISFLKRKPKVMIDEKKVLMNELNTILVCAELYKIGCHETADAIWKTWKTWLKEKK